MRRREFIALLGGTAMTTLWLLNARAQQPNTMVRLGIICSGACEGTGYDALNNELRRLGWIEGQNLLVDRRAALGDHVRLPPLAAEIVALKPNIIVSVGPQATRSAKDAAGIIPIVMAGVADPVGAGLVQSLAQPGGTVTGFTTLAPGGFGSKMLGLLKEALPAAKRVAVLLNPKNEVSAKLYPGDIPPAAARIGVRLQVVEASSADQIQSAIDAAKQEEADAVIVYGDPLFHNPPARLPGLLGRAGLPAIYLVSEVSRAGGLMSYGPDFEDMFVRVAGYVDRILKGAKPSNLPVQEPIKYVLTINQKSAKALGMVMPATLLIRADEVIE
jgi:putative ABC transport system substrate-binding protein